MSKLLACQGGQGRIHVVFVDSDGECWHIEVGSNHQGWQRLPRLTIDAGGSARHFALYGSTSEAAMVEASSDCGCVQSTFIDNRWTGWRESAERPRGSAAASAISSKEVTVSTEGTARYRPDEAHAWRDLGGCIVGGHDHLALVERGSEQSVLVAVWCGRVVTTRRLDADSLWDLVDAVPTTTPVYSLLRTRDLASLTVYAQSLRERVTTEGVREWVGDSTDSRLIVDLPPQHIAETVLTESSPDTSARIAGPTTLHFVVPAGKAIALTVDGVLAAMNDCRLDVAAGTTTTLELPWTMRLGLHKNARCHHRPEPLTTSDGVTPMWHTRILGPGPSGYSPVFPIASLTVDSQFAGGTPLRDKVPKIVQQALANPTTPVDVDRLILSSAGAWFSGSVKYPQIEWTHRTVMGRDYYVRLLEQGVLFPFGHRASVVGIAERRFDSTERVAALRERFALVITEASRPYGSEARHEREFPFQQVDIEPLEVLDLDKPPLGQHAYWLTRGLTAVSFRIRAKSVDQFVPMTLPLIFSDEDPSLSASTLSAMYRRGPDRPIAGSRSTVGGPPRTDINQFIPLAVRKVGSKVEAVALTEQFVQSLTFEANAISGGTGFHPRLAELEVQLPAVKQLLGQQLVIRATLSPNLTQLSPTDLPDELLRFDPQPLSFGSAQTSAVAAPNMRIDRIFRTLGPTVGDLPTEPRKLFDSSARLLGIVPLTDIIGNVTGRPSITWSQAPNPTATLTWTEKPTKRSGPFEPIASPIDACTLKLSVRTDRAGDRLITTTDGSLTNFKIGIPGPDDFLVKLVFSSLTFHAETGQLPTTSFKITSAQLGKELNFVQQLSSYLPRVGDSAPALQVSATQIQVRYAISVPTPIGMGLFTLQNLLVQAGVTLSLSNQPVVVDFAFGTRAHPFLVTVMGCGGGGYLELGVRAGGADSGLDRFVGGIEFGASVAVNFGVAAGEVHVFGGVVFTKQGANIEIAGYLRLGGSVQVLGLISVSIELTVSLTFHSPNILRGAARLVITVDLTFWSESVEIECEYTFVGSDHSLAGSVPSKAPQHTVEEAWGPDSASFPWQSYCQAFA
ncbi:hypothetical protein [Rhodococcus opacus]|uniref:hypothetical protein n=1 Tax=Rhodococcus opacus TaxID=37919 RepID=UPI00155ABC8B|nr:hypothetical protein [Rhodococcus opacus]